jgi:hypothetical protein
VQLAIADGHHHLVTGIGVDDRGPGVEQLGCRRRERPLGGLDDLGQPSLVGTGLGQRGHGGPQVQPSPLAQA